MTPQELSALRVEALRLAIASNPGTVEMPTILKMARKFYDFLATYTAVPETP